MGSAKYYDERTMQGREAYNADLLDATYDDELWDVDDEEGDDDGVAYAKIREEVLDDDVHLYQDDDEYD